MRAPFYAERPHHFGRLKAKPCGRYTALTRPVWGGQGLTVAQAEKLGLPCAPTNLFISVKNRGCARTSALFSEQHRRHRLWIFQRT